jgi:hypothetical protein
MSGDSGMTHDYLLVVSIFQERSYALGPTDDANLLVQKMWLG